MRIAFALEGGNQLDKLIFDLTESKARGAKTIILFTTDEEDVNNQLSKLVGASTPPLTDELPAPHVVFFGAITTLAFDADIESLMEAVGDELDE